MVLIHHLETPITPISIDKSVHYGDLAHTSCLDRHGHHIVVTRLIEAHVHNRLLSLLEQLDSSTE